MLSSSNHIVAELVQIEVGFEGVGEQDRKKRGPLFTVELAEGLRGEG